MSQTAKELLKQALALPEEERVEFADALWSRLEASAEASPNPACFATKEIADAWTEELDRRDQALKDGKMRLLTHEEVRANVREFLGP